MNKPYYDLTDGNHVVDNDELTAKRLVALHALAELYAAYFSELDEIKEDGLSAPNLISLYGSIRKSLALVEERIKELDKLKDHLKFKAIPETFDRDGIKTLTGTNGDRVTVTTETLASILAENRTEAYRWLRQNGHGDLIVEYIFPMTLKSFAKTQMESTGEDFPPESCIRVELRDTTSFTAGKDSPNKI